MKINQKKIALALLAIVCVLFIFFLTYITHTTENQNLKFTTNISDYGNFYGFKGFSNLDVFPTKILNSAKNIEFYYKDDSSPVFDDSCQVYLKCTYHKNDYQNEILRLTSIIEQYQGEKQKTWLNNTNYNYPAVVAIDNNNHCYEYALLDEDNFSIIYVFLQFIYKKDVIFASNYLPHNFTNPDEPINKADEGKSIYLFELSNGDNYGTDGKWLKAER